MLVYWTLILDANAQSASCVGQLVQVSSSSHSGDSSKRNVYSINSKYKPYERWEQNSQKKNKKNIRLNALDLASLDFVKMAPTWREENGTAARAEAALRTSSLSSSPPLVIADTTTTKNVGKNSEKTAKQVSFVFISNSLRCFASIHSLEDLAFGHGPLHNQREPVLQRPHVRGRTADSSELAPVRRPRDGQFVRRLRFFYLLLFLLFQ